METAARDHLQAGEALGLRYALALPQSALAGQSGSRIGRRAGTSIDFQDYREYQPGDDLRSIDWNVFARSDRLTIKLFREEVNPHLDLVLDGSRSMRLDGSEKSTALLRLAAALAMAAENAQCTHAAWLAGDGFQRVANDALRPSAWDGFAFESRRNIEESFAILPPRLRRLGIRVLVSDLLWPGNPLSVLRRLADSAAEVFVIQLLARADSEPPEHGNIHLVDSETGEGLDLFVDAAVAGEYRDNLARHQEAWHDACRQCGARLVPVADDDFEGALAALEQAGVLLPA
ncbi:MAG: DUF58 domain-containing protein [Verrucomicrobia bacterium]|nr:DUF58 domain-containing protein [Verrucomicrobiota bacterium]